MERNLTYTCDGENTLTLKADVQGMKNILVCDENRDQHSIETLNKTDQTEL